MGKKLRGTGVRHTIAFVGRFAGLWMLVTICAVLVAAGSAWLLFAQRSAGAVAERFLHALELQTGLTVLAVIALAVFTTHRLAGPWIAVRRACDAVRAGDLSFRLRIRASDANIKDVERAFNAMMDALEQRSAAASAPAAEPGVAAKAR